MKKILYLLILFLPINVYALEYPELYSPNALVYDLTEDHILYEQNKEVETSIASLTKILTTITAIEKIDNLDTSITYTSSMAKEVSKEASIAHLVPETKYTYRDLLYASMLPSGADATTALAISLSGSLSNYVNDMNNLASRIGMSNSHFVNVTGLDDNNHYSTLEDLLTLLKYSLSNETFKEIYTTKKYTLSTMQIVNSTITGKNYDTSKIIGSKTGFTQNAGLCISVLFKVLDHDMLLITTGANPNTNRYLNIIDALTLIEFIENNYSYQTLSSANSQIKELPVKHSNINTYPIITNQDIILFLPSDYNESDFKIEYIGLDELSYKTKDSIGTINYYYQNKLIATEDVPLNIEIKFSIKTIYKEYHSQIHLSIIIIIIILLILLIPKRIYKKRRG